MPLKDTGYEYLSDGLPEEVDLGPEPMQQPTAAPQYEDLPNDFTGLTKSLQSDFKSKFNKPFNFTSPPGAAGYKGIHTRLHKNDAADIEGNLSDEEANWLVDRGIQYGINVKDYRKNWKQIGGTGPHIHMDMSWDKGSAPAPKASDYEELEDGLPDIQGEVDPVVNTLLVQAPATPEIPAGLPRLAAQEEVNISAGDDTGLEDEVYREWYDNLKIGNYGKAGLAAEIYNERFPDGKYAKHIYNPITGKQPVLPSERKETRDGSVAIPVNDLLEAGLSGDDLRREVERRFSGGLGLDDADREVFRQRHGFDPGSTAGYYSGRTQVKQSAQDFENWVKANAGPDGTVKIRVPRSSVEKLQEFYNEKGVSDPTQASAESSAQSVKGRMDMIPRWAAAIPGIGQFASLLFNTQTQEDLFGSPAIDTAQQGAAGVAQGMLGTAGATLKGAGILIKEGAQLIGGEGTNTPISNLLIGLGNRANNFLKRASFENTSGEGINAFSLGQGFGSAATFAASGGSSKVATALLGAFSEAGSAYDETYDQLIAQGLNKDAAHKAAVNSAILHAPVGLTEVFGVGGALGRALEKGVPGAGWWRNLFGAMLHTAAEEGGQEFSQTILENMIQKTAGDKNRKWTKDAFTSAIIGTITGGVTQGVTHTAVKKIIDVKDSKTLSQFTELYKSGADISQEQWREVHGTLLRQAADKRGVSEDDIHLREDVSDLVEELQQRRPVSRRLGAAPANALKAQSVGPFTVDESGIAVQDPSPPSAQPVLEIVGTQQNLSPEYLAKVNKKGASNVISNSQGEDPKDKPSPDLPGVVFDSRSGDPLEVLEMHGEDYRVRSQQGKIYIIHPSNTFTPDNITSENKGSVVYDVDGVPLQVLGTRPDSYVVRDESGRMFAIKQDSVTSKAPESLLEEAPTVPETLQTLNAQVQSLVDGKKKAVLITNGEQMPAIPQGYVITETEAGTFIHNPLELGQFDVALAVAKGDYGDLIGYASPKPQPGEDAVYVIAKDENGNELQSAVVYPEAAEEQKAIFENTYPGAVIDTGTDEGMLAQVLDQRINGPQESAIEVVSQEEAKTTGPEGIVKRLRDQNRAVERKLDTDALTGVQSAAAFHDAKPFIDQDPNREWVSIDLNNFKPINDTEGHEAGDRALQAVGQGMKELQRTSHPQAQLFRQGGDEFAIAVPRGQGEAAARGIERLIGSRELSNGRIYSVSAGVGNTFAEADANLTPAKATRKQELGGVQGAREEIQEVPQEPEAAATEEPVESGVQPAEEIQPTVVAETAVPGKTDVVEGIKKDLSDRHEGYPDLSQLMQEIPSIQSLLLDAEFDALEQLEAFESLGVRFKNPLHMVGSIRTIQTMQGAIPVTDVIYKSRGINANYRVLGRFPGGEKILVITPDGDTKIIQSPYGETGNIRIKKGGASREELAAIPEVRWEDIGLLSDIHPTKAEIRRVNPAANSVTDLTEAELEQYFPQTYKNLKEAEDFFGHVGSADEAMSIAHSEEDGNSEPAMVQAARERLRDLFSNPTLKTDLGYTTVRALYDTAIVTGWDTYKLFKDKTQWLARMLERLGDNIKPHLEDVWNTIANNKPPMFFSPLERGLQLNMPRSAPAIDVKGILKNAGVSDDEMKWTGFEDFLREKALKESPVTRQEALDFFQESQVRITETIFQDDESLNSENTMRREALRTKKNLAEIELAEKLRAIDIPQTEIHDIQLEAANSGRNTFNQSLAAYFSGFPKFQESKPELEVLADNLQRIESDLLDTLYHPRGGTKFTSYTTPGGTNHREITLSLPHRDMSFEEYRRRAPEATEEDTRRFYNEAKGSLLGPRGVEDYQVSASHMYNVVEADRNRIALLRVNDRVGPNGEKLLHVDEFQDDLQNEIQGIKKRIREYDEMEQTGRVAPKRKDDLKIVQKTLQDDLSRLGSLLPFRGKSHELGFKYALGYAIAHGYDGLTWSTGDIVRDRYNLAARIDELQVSTSGADAFITKPKLDEVYIHAYKQGSAIVSQIVPVRELSDWIGQDKANEALESLRNGKDYKATGLQLAKGGEGKLHLYDKMIPDFLKRYTKKWGGEVGLTSIVSHTYTGPIQEIDIHHLTITPQMRDSILRSGQSLFGSSEGIPNEVAESMANLREIQTKKRRNPDLTSLPKDSTDILDSIRNSSKEAADMVARSDTFNGDRVTKQAITRASNSGRTIRLLSGEIPAYATYKPNSNRLYVNPAAEELLRMLRSAVTGKEVPSVNGTTFDTPRLSELVRMAQGFEELTSDPSGKALLRDLRNAFTKSIQAQQPLTVARVWPGNELDTGTRGTIKHEEVHRTEIMIRNAFDGLLPETDALLSLPHMDKLNNDIKAIGYEGDPIVVAMESIARIITGDSKGLSLTEDEQLDFLEGYFHMMEDTYGEGVIGRYKLITNKAKEVRDAVKAERFAAQGFESPTALAWSMERGGQGSATQEAQGIARGIEERIQQSREELNSRISNGQLGRNPVDDSYHASIVTGYEEYKPGMDRNSWNDMMIDQLGERARPHLDAAWDLITGETATTDEPSYVLEARNRMAGKKNIVDQGIITGYDIFQKNPDYDKASWSNSMVRQLGQGIKPYLDGIWIRLNIARDIPTAVVIQELDSRLKAKKSKKSIAKDIKKLFKGIKISPELQSTNWSQVFSEEDGRTISEIIQQELKTPRGEEFESKRKTPGEDIDLSALFDELVPPTEKPDEGEHGRRRRHHPGEGYYEQESEDYVDIFGKPTLMEDIKRLRNIRELANFSRAWLTASLGDFSATLRQGLVFAGSKPIRGLIKPFGKQLGAYVSQSYYEKAAADIAKRPLFQAMMDAGLALSGPSGQREEMFRSEIAERFPWVKWAKRAFETYMNEQRANAFEDFYKEIEQGSSYIPYVGQYLPFGRAGGRKFSDDPGPFYAMARFVNSATARGDMYAISNAIHKLISGKELGRNTDVEEAFNDFYNTGFFSARLQKGRVDLLNPFYYFGTPTVRGGKLRFEGGLDTPARIIAMRKMFELTGVLSGVAAIASAFGGKVEWDPDDPDFGDLVIGDVHVNITSGFSDYIALGLRLGRSAFRGQWGQMDKDVTLFLRKKLAPLPASYFNLKYGKDVYNQPTDWKHEMIRNLTPIMVSNAIQGYERAGLPGAGVMVAGEAVGLGINIYKDFTPPDRTVIEEKLIDKARKHFGDEPMTAEDKERLDKEREIVSLLKEGKKGDAVKAFNQAVKAGTLAPMDEEKLSKKATMSYLQYNVSLPTMNLESALDIFIDPDCTEQERKDIAPLIADKYEGYMNQREEDAENSKERVARKVFERVMTKLKKAKELGLADMAKAKAATAK